VVGSAQDQSAPISFSGGLSADSTDAPVNDHPNQDIQQQPPNDEVLNLSKSAVHKEYSSSSYISSFSSSEKTSADSSAVTREDLTSTFTGVRMKTSAGVTGESGGTCVGGGSLTDDNSLVVAVEDGLLAPLNVSVDGGAVTCHVCTVAPFRDNLALKEHLETVHPREMYHCTVERCDKIFSTRKSRNRHSQNENLHRHLINGGGVVDNCGPLRSMDTTRTATTHIGGVTAGIQMEAGI